VATGKITSIRADRGFGFIAATDAGDSGKDIFFHCSAVIETPFEELREGQQVSFETGPDPRDPSRLRATQVRELGASEE